jgi:hypothetical protein
VGIDPALLGLFILPVVLGRPWAPPGPLVVPLFALGGMGGSLKVGVMRVPCELLAVGGWLQADEKQA